MWLAILSVLRALPWRKLVPYIIGAVAVLVVVIKMQVLTSSLEKAKAREISYVSQIATAKESIQKLGASITEQNKAVEKIKIESDRADAARKLADDLAVEVDRGKSRIVAANRRIKLLECKVANLPACETYEAALEVISGVSNGYHD